VMLLMAKKTFQRTLPAVPSTVAELRVAVADFAASLGACGEKLEAIRLAVSEAVTNAVIHAYRDEPGSVTVTATPASGELWVLVSDVGCGHQAPAVRPGLGWGLALVAEASDEFVVAERSGGGTEVRMCFRLCEDATSQPLESSRPASSAAAPSFSTTT
jgi:anti-sigma regulatory factor (Ser/Thr protein kinase)